MGCLQYFFKARIMPQIILYYSFFKKEKKKPQPFKKTFKRKILTGDFYYKNFIPFIIENTGIKSRNFIAVIPIGSKIYRTSLDNGY